MLLFCLGIILGEFVGIIIMCCIQVGKISNYESTIEMLEERNKRLENIIVLMEKDNTNKEK